MAIVGLALSLYICTLIVSMIGGFVRFLCDIRKWKSPEDKVHITVKEFEHDLEQAGTDEKEVTGDEGNVEQCGSPIIF